jgi:RimJ/RimL family protein N-acetyltransferase
MDLFNIPCMSYRSGHTRSAPHPLSLHSKQTKVIEVALRLNEYEQPIGAALPDWHGARLPGRESLAGRYCRLEPVDVERHAAELYEAYRDAPDGRDWTYMAAGPFETLEAYRAYLTKAAALADPMHFAVIDSATGQAVGTLSLMRIDAPNGVIEVGHIAYSPRLKRTRIATEAVTLLMKLAFEELGYRRFEWKCDSLNAPSRAAALRYGFTFEGIFRQAIVTRGRSRDTAWYSIIDGEYPALSAAYAGWLEPRNFDARGKQRKALADFIAQ